MSPPTLLTEWARLLLGSLRCAGLRDVVVSPGSRSTPFTWAAMADPGLRCRTLVDERSAAFFAVGHARLTGDPVLLICTSGSAAANYFPALVEAAESGTPVLVLTADRPLELQQAAAPQTLDQVKLYGDYARAYFELGTPDADARMLRAIPRIAAQAMLASRSPVPGPVHLNARARKPLEPREGHGPGEQELRSAVDRLMESVPRAPEPETRASPEAVGRVAEACRRASRGLIVCGPAAPGEAATAETIAALADASGFPVVAEPASQLRFADLGQAVTLSAFATLLEIPGFAESRAPDLVIQIGRPPTASAWHRALELWSETERHVLSSRGWPDPWSSAASVVMGRLDATARQLADALSEPNGAGGSDAARDGDLGRSAWAAGLREADVRARALIDGALTGELSEGAAVRAVVERLAHGSVLAVGNSLPIREVETFGPAGARDLTVWFQRGVNGIDGLISGAAGAAAASGRPTTLLIGDVSFVHDLGGLAAMRDLPAPLTVVVLNNGGGRIFERLPLGERLSGDPRLDAWLTPPRVDFRAAAETFRLDYERAEDLGAVTVGLGRLAGTGGVLEVVIPEGGTTAHQRELRDRLTSELRPWLEGQPETGPANRRGR